MTLVDFACCALGMHAPADLPSPPPPPCNRPTLQHRSMKSARSANIAVLTKHSYWRNTASRLGTKTPTVIHATAPMYRNPTSSPATSGFGCGGVELR
eukprot:365162-Chlamydomonas_euryale.AAC.5